MTDDELSDLEKHAEELTPWWRKRVLAIIAEVRRLRAIIEVAESP